MSFKLLFYSALGIATYPLSSLSDPALSLLALLLQGLRHGTGDEVGGQLSESGAHGTRLSLRREGPFGGGSKNNYPHQGSLRV